MIYPRHTLAANAARALAGQKPHVAPVRWSFVQDTTPPLAGMLRGGRGGGVRLKLFLSILWLAHPEPHQVQLSGHSWAILLGLADPSHGGARRVNDALHWLASHDLIWLSTKRGRPTQVRLLREDASGQPYFHPADRLRELRSVRPRSLAAASRRLHYYVTVPYGLWTRGWLATLSGAGIAMLLVLLVELGGRMAPDTMVWLSPLQAKRQYGLSADIRRAGIRDLSRYGIVRVSRSFMDPDHPDIHRVRQYYRLRPNVFSEAVEIPFLAPAEPESKHQHA